MFIFEEAGLLIALHVAVEVLGCLRLGQASLYKSLNVLEEHIVDLTSLDYGLASKYGPSKQGAAGHIRLDLLQKLQNLLDLHTLEGEVLQIVDLMGVADLVLKHLEQEGQGRLDNFFEPDHLEHDGSKQIK